MRIHSLFAPSADVDDDDCARSRSFTLLLLSYIAGAADDGDEDFSGDLSSTGRKKSFLGEQGCQQFQFHGTNIFLYIVTLNLDLSTYLCSGVFARKTEFLWRQLAALSEGSPAAIVWAGRREDPPSDVRKLLWDDRERAWKRTGRIEE